LPFGIVVALGVVLVADIAILSAQASDPRIGTWVDAEGGRTATQYTANFDGKDYPLTGSPNADTVSLKRIDARTTERTDKKGGKVTVTLTRVVAQDGKTMTVTVRGTNPQGQAVNTVIVFDKQ